MKLPRRSQEQSKYRSWLLIRNPIRVSCSDVTIPPSGALSCQKSVAVQCEPQRWRESISWLGGKAVRCEITQPSFRHLSKFLERVLTGTYALPHSVDSIMLHAGLLHKKPAAFANPDARSVDVPHNVIR